MFHIDSIWLKFNEWHVEVNKKEKTLANIELIDGLKGIYWQVIDLCEMYVIFYEVYAMKFMICKN